MAEIKPFKGVLYNPMAIGGDHSRVCAPPYDVISPGMQEELHSRNKFNVVRLILPMEKDQAYPGASKYERAGKLLGEWINGKVLLRDNEDAIYIYQQEYPDQGKKCRRLGFLALMKLDDPKGEKVLPHEHTHQKPKEDRLSLIREVRGNLSPIFTLFPDTDGAVTAVLKGYISRNAPVVDIEFEGVRNVVWRLSDAPLISSVRAKMKDKKVFIADGHHRYEVAGLYRNELIARGIKVEDEDYVMTYFADMDSPDNLTVLATHRAIKKMPSGATAAIEKILSDKFDVVKCSGLDDVLDKLAAGVAKNTFGYSDKGKYLAFSLKKNADVNTIIREEKPLEWKKLDVSLLHFSIFPDIGVLQKEGNIIYSRDASEAESLVTGGSCEGAFYMNPTGIDQLKKVALTGERMPQKSTFFYPKLLSGLVFNKFNERNKAVR